VRNVSRNDAPRRAVGEREEAVLVDGGALRVAAARQQRDDATAVFRLSGHLDAGDRRQLGSLCVVPLPDEDVEKVHTRGTDAYRGLTLGHVWIGHIAELEHLRATRLLDDDRLHGMLRTICVQRAEARSTRSAS